jgi:hypothetical protein
LHSEHHQKATPFQRFSEDLTARAAQPTFIAWLTILIVIWIGSNLAMVSFGRKPFGPPSSGNRAFDEYRVETSKRLEEEQTEFKDFLDRLRHAKDKEEFDQFIAQHRPRPTPPSDAQPKA